MIIVICSSLNEVYDEDTDWYNNRDGDIYTVYSILKKHLKIVSELANHTFIPATKVIHFAKQR